MLPEIKIDISQNDKLLKSISKAIEKENIIKSLEEFQVEANATLTQMIEELGEASGDNNMDDDDEDEEDDDNAAKNNKTKGDKDTNVTEEDAKDKDAKIKHKKSKRNGRSSESKSKKKRCG